MRPNKRILPEFTEVDTSKEPEFFDEIEDIVPEFFGTKKRRKIGVDISDDIEVNQPVTDLDSFLRVASDMVTAPKIEQAKLNKKNKIQNGLQTLILHIRDILVIIILLKFLIYGIQGL